MQTGDMRNVGRLSSTSMGQLGVSSLSSKENNTFYKIEFIDADGNLLAAIVDPELKISLPVVRWLSFLGFLFGRISYGYISIETPLRFGDKSLRTALKDKVFTTRVTVYHNLMNMRLATYRNCRVHVSYYCHGRNNTTLITDNSVLTQYLKIKIRKLK